MSTLQGYKNKSSLQQRIDQMEQQLQLVEKYSKEVPTSRVQLERLENLYEHYNKKINRPLLNDYMYDVEGNFVKNKNF